MPVYITGMGLVTPAGCGLATTRKAILRGIEAFESTRLFSVPEDKRFPVGEVFDLPETPETKHLPRTHRLALTAAREAMVELYTNTRCRGHGCDHRGYADHGTGFGRR